MPDDYLWDRTGSDPEIAELEAALAPYRYRGRRRARWWKPVLAAAAVLAGAVLLFRPGDAGWDMQWIEGRSGRDRLAVGRWLQTGARERVRIAIADIGHVQLDPGSRVRLVRTGAEEHRLELARGRLQAFVTAPPRLFVVDTPAARAVDLGCIYTLAVEPDGSGELHVLAGYVQLENDDAILSYVPSGARCSMHPQRGPGVPWFARAPAPVRDVDPTDLDAVARAVGAARPVDSLTLWHLLPRVHPSIRRAVYARLAFFEPPPDGVTKEQILALDRDALLRWRDELELMW